MSKEGPVPLEATKTEDLVSAHVTFCASTNKITLTGYNYTLRWAAPELLMEGQVGLWSDIWSLGWIAFEVSKLQLFERG